MNLIKDRIDEKAAIDILQKGKKEDWFVGRPFYVDYSRMHLLISDAWKHRVQGIPQGTFLLAFYDGEDGVEEALLLRAIGPTKLPTDSEVVASMIEYYKDGMDTSGRAGAERQNAKLDTFTRYEFSFSGLDCRILGAFYKVEEPFEENGETKYRIITEFGADLENFYSANNYSVYKPTGDVLERIVNQRDRDELHGGEKEFPIGRVRYSSSRRFQKNMETIPVYISPKDFLGKRTALFGMTRTGKSNTVKKVIEATVEISDKAVGDLAQDEQLVSANTAENTLFNPAENLDPLTQDGTPKYPVGQVIFDVNGEYANANMQDDGTAIFELYRDKVTRFSVLDKPGFKVMKVNFFKEVNTGFELIANYFRERGDSSDYLNNFLAVSLEEPDDYGNDQSVRIRFDRRRAAYLCCLFRAGFTPPPGFQIKFQGAKELNEQVREGGIDPSRGISPNDAIIWFEQVWKHYNEWEYFKKKQREKGKEWADDDLKAMLVMLTKTKVPGKSSNVSGWLKLKTSDLLTLHTNKSETPFEDVIVGELRKGRIVIVDLSQGSPAVKNMFSERLCRKVFDDSMSRFIRNVPNNFIQFYFEEAHNLFPKKEDKDLSQIYNRIAKEGAKLNLGMIYATQEVSSISSNILKNTQNWFIAHLNNEDELRELKKYYDFEDFTDSLVRFSASNDKGFVRMKTYTNPYVVPVQIDRFLANR